MAMTDCLAALAAVRVTLLARLAAQELLDKDMQAAAHLAQLAAQYMVALAVEAQGLWGQTAVHLLQAQAVMAYPRASLAPLSPSQVVAVRVVKVLALVALAVMVAATAYWLYRAELLAAQAKQTLEVAVVAQVGRHHLAQTVATAVLVL